jgi:hypothetical protein
MNTYTRYLKSGAVEDAGTGFTNYRDVWET